MDISIVIPTFNGEKRLPHLLDSLIKQKISETIKWEVLVVDNNSRDHTRGVVSTYQKRGDFPCELRYAMESRQGLAYARQRGVEEAAGKCVGFLDDDCVLIDDWVSAAYRFGESHPDAGLWGSRIFPEYEITPPDGFDKIKHFFGNVDRGEKPFVYTKKMGVTPAGLGLVVRKKAWIGSVNKKLFTATRRGQDVEAALNIQKSIWEVWHNPDMKLTHFMNKERFNVGYIKRICFEAGKSRIFYRFTRNNKWKWPFIVVLGVFIDGARYLSYLIKNGKKIASGSVAEIGKAEFLRGTFLALFVS